MTVIVRFAPSPTGHLHLGNVRAAIITWLFARKEQGKFVLRIDDTDLQRSKEEFTVSIKETMTWLGLDWDESFHQRGRENLYDAAIEKLKETGRLYPCYETEDELGLKRKSLLGRGLPPVYDRAALNLTEEQVKAHEDNGRKPHWRFKLNHSPIQWHDHIRGEVNFHGKDLSDPVLIREDGTPLYHICSVVDDIDAKITHVIRGEDHVSNTASHIQMFEALGAKAPDFAHLSILAGNNGEKLSKRNGALSAKELKENLGVEAMSIVSLIARLGTSESVEPMMNIQTAIDGFDFSKFSRNMPKFDTDELIRLNSKILHDTEFDQVQERLTEMGLSDIDADFWQVARANIQTLSDIEEWYRVAKGPVEPVIEDSAFAETAASLLPDAPWDNTTWKTWSNAVKTETGRKGKELFMPLRCALTGKQHGPEMRDLLPLIGRERALERLKAA